MLQSHFLGLQKAQCNSLPPLQIRDVGGHLTALEPHPGFQQGLMCKAGTLTVTPKNKDGGEQAFRASQTLLERQVYTLTG